MTADNTISINSVTVDNLKISIEHKNKQFFHLQLDTGKMFYSDFLSINDLNRRCHKSLDGLKRVI